MQILNAVHTVEATLLKQGELVDGLFPPYCTKRYANEELDSKSLKINKFISL